ncbi:hypothetical protein GCM10023108_55770 [Saccharopolyspora hordei]|uniref:Uncharacterized protein n=1 Tax=Saccharopolyspora hordei TaxID=1838 RepID=A0A853AQE8_9PSEU|nr:hypothetical protein [Saccharopolyspora hordei]NYI82871.1 hypothetical protein [Saccharopolyspora hordei]
MSDWRLEIPSGDRVAPPPEPAWSEAELEEIPMGKRARKKKDRKKNKANHGKRPGA